MKILMLVGCVFLLGCATIAQNPTEFKGVIQESSMGKIKEAVVPATKLSVAEKRMVVFANTCLAKIIEIQNVGTFSNSVRGRGEYRPTLVREKDNSTLYLQHKTMSGCGPFATCPKDGLYVAFLEIRQVGADVKVKSASYSFGGLKIDNFHEDAMSWLTDRGAFCPKLDTV